MRVLEGYLSSLEISSSELFEVGSEVLSYAIGNEERLNGNLNFMFNRLAGLGF